MNEFPRYLSAQLHCHSSIEGPASIGAHCFEAKRAGVDVVWLTDHDTRISLCIGGPFLDRFDFESPDLTTTVERTATGGGVVRRNVGWSIARRDERLATGAVRLSRAQYYRGTQSLYLEAVAGEQGNASVGSADERTVRTGEAPQPAAEWQYLVVDFKADAKIHSRPLLAGATVGLAVRLEEASDGEAWLDLVLSEQPPDLRQARLRYLLTGPSEDASEEGEKYKTRTSTLSAPAGEWTRHEIRPVVEAALDDLGGEDNALVGLRLGVRVRRGGRVRLFVDDLTIAHECAGNELHARQRALARELGARHGVVCHVAQEISQAGQHKNAWGASLPLLDYPSQPSGFSHQHGVEWARRHDAVFSLNHPFSAYNRADVDDALREKVLEEMVEAYVSNGASGANTLEVGFPAGRHQFDLDHYLRLWDGLSRRGVIVTGSGSSDAHSARVGWQTGNNFATFIRAESTDEAALLAGLRSGNVFMADPIRFRSRLRFGDVAGHRMGQVVRVDGSGDTEQEVVLALDRSQPYWRLHWVVDGERHPAIMLAEGMVEHRLRVNVSESTFVRAEVWDSRLTPAGLETEDAGGRCVLLTNPVWYVPGQLPLSVASERLAAG
jgi:hypothetical protein